MDPDLIQKIFTRYEVRGKYPEEMSPRVAYLVGRAFVDYYGFAKTKIAVGQDMRLSSPELAKNFIKGAMEQGADVLDLGQASTPMVHFAINQGKLQGGAMITASHAPKEENGIKLITRETVPVSIETGLVEIANAVAGEHFTNPVSTGSYETHSILKEYIDHTMSLVDVSSIVPDMKVVVDTGNGMAGIWIRELMARVNAKFSPLFLELDGKFPHHPADPLTEANLADLKKTVINERAMLGAALDGDGDQIVFIDDKGNTIRPDYATGLIAMSVLNTNKNGIVGYDVRSSYVVRDAALSMRGRVMRTPVNHGETRKLMRENNLLFAGEVSGHYFFSVDDYQINPALSLLHVMLVISKTKAPLSALLKPFAVYAQSGEQNIETPNAASILKSLEAKYQLGTISHLDGLSVEFDDWWFNARPASNGQHLRINLEAKNAEILSRKLDEILRLVRG